MASASIPMSISFILVGLDAVIIWVVPAELFISTLDLLKGKRADNLEVYLQRGLVCLNRLDAGLLCEEISVEELCIVESS